ncbi:hypothetical protein BDV12DRAFT_200865 [Aspergillus spectabilis]
MCPEFTATRHFDDVTAEQMKVIEPMVVNFQAYAGPGFKGPRPVADSVRNVLAVIEKLRVEIGNSGAFVSYKGDQNWTS